MSSKIGDWVPAPWPLSKTNFPGPKPGMKFSNPAPDNTGLPITAFGTAG
jgi:hypothetical protein